MNGPTFPAAVVLSARLDVPGVAKVLGFRDHDIPILVKAGLLKPLGAPAPNAPKYFARCEIEQRAADIKWLDKATRVISGHWRQKNQRRQVSNVPHE